MPGAGAASPVPVLVNPDAGPHGRAAEHLRELLPAASVERIAPDELPRRLGHLVERGAPVVGVCGGDGTLRAAAGVLVGTGTVLWPFPGGTKNNFCGALGIDDLAAGASAVDEGAVVDIDVGDVNGEVFVNNSSLGFYPATVRAREDREARMPKRVAHLLAVRTELARHRRLTCRLDEGAWRRAWLVFVGNGTYGDDLLRVGERDALSDGLLDARLVAAEGRLPRLRALVDLALGRIDDSPVVVRVQRPSLTIDVRGATVVEVALDGEVVELAPPLRYRVRARALRVRAPAGSGAAGEGAREQGPGATRFPLA